MENNKEVINVEALILSTNKKRIQNFIAYLNMKNSDCNSDDSDHSFTVFSFRNQNLLEIKDKNIKRTFRVNFSIEYSEDKFYHCFVLLYDTSDQNSYDKTIDTFAPLIRKITSKLDFDFVLLMIGEYNDYDFKRNEKIYQIENTKDFETTNGFFLLEMNFKQRTRKDSINKIFKKRLCQSYRQFPEYYDKSLQTERHILNALKTFAFNYDDENDHKDGEDNVVLVGSLFSESSMEMKEYFNFENNHNLPHEQFDSDTYWLNYKKLGISSKSNINFNTNMNLNTVSTNKSTIDNEILFNLKIIYKEIICEMGITSNDTSEEIAKMINYKFRLELNTAEVYTLAKNITNKINKYIRFMGKVSKDNMNNQNTVINLNKILTQRRVNLVISLNNKIFKFYLKSENIFKNERLEDIIEEILQSLPSDVYILESLSEILKSTIIMSIKDSLRIN